MTKGVIFDWGGVLCVNPATDFINACSDALGTSPHLLKPVLNGFLDSFQRGTIDESSLWRNVCTILNIPDYDYTQPIWRSAFESFYTPHLSVIEIAKALNVSGIKIGFLSNTEAPAMTLHKDLHYTFIDAHVYSCEEGLLKPQPEIYQLMAHRLNLDPKECIMIDDKIENIIGAENVGMKGIHFTTFSELYLSLKNLCTFSL